MKYTYVLSSICMKLIDFEKISLMTITPINVSF